MELLEHIETQMAVTKLPLVAITIAAVPCRDTPVIMTLHWHGFIRERLIDDESREPVSFTPVPSSALQVNQRWGDLLDLDRAAMEAGWELGAWDVARAELPSCTRPGADQREAVDCLKAFGQFPWGVNGNDVVVGFRPVRGSIWTEVADDLTLRPDGTREPPCPLEPVAPRVDRARRTVYRFGMPGNARIQH
jgi:hypothetical protein